VPAARPKAAAPAIPADETRAIILNAWRGGKRPAARTRIRARRRCAAADGNCAGQAWMVSSPASSAGRST